MVGRFGQKELEDKIKELMQIDTIPLMIQRQIEKYVLERRWSFLDIARALAYFVAVQGGTLNPRNGIAIVPYVIDDARKYFKAEEEKTKQQRADSEQFLKTKDSSYDIECKKPRKTERRQSPLIDIGSISFEEDS